MSNTRGKESPTDKNVTLQRKKQTKKKRSPFPLALGGIHKR